jgi:hypothetical protein
LVQIQLWQKLTGRPLRGDFFNRMRDKDGPIFGALRALWRFYVIVTVNGYVIGQ